MINQIAAAFSSRSFYKQVAETWKREWLTYLFTLLAICLIPSTIGVVVGIIEMKKIGAEVVSQVPRIFIKDGEVHTEPEAPVNIEMQDGDQKIPLAIIDTTGNTLNLENTKAVVLLTKNKIIFKKNGFGQVEEQSHDLSKVKEFELNQADLYSWLQSITIILGILIYPLMLLFEFVYRTIQAAIYAVIALIFSAMFKANLSYSQLFNVSIAALTPPIVLAVVFSQLEMIGIHIPFSWLILFIIGIGYLIFGVRATKE